MDYPHFDRASNNSPLDDTELQAFDELLAQLPGDGAMNVEGVDGYLTALLVGPREVLSGWRSADWLPLVWGGDGPDGEPFASNRQRKRATVLVLRHLQSIACQLRDHPRQWEPLFSIVESAGQEWVDGQDWCTGFLQGMDLMLDRWAECHADADLGPALAAIMLLGGDEPLQPGSPAELELAHPAWRDALARRVVAGVIAWAERDTAGAQAGVPPLKDAGDPRD
jgi:uncharacterized protein